jgi:hypothetical protein
MTTMRPSTGTNSGFMVVAEAVHDDGNGLQSGAAANLHVSGERSGPDKIVIPGEQLQP